LSSHGGFLRALGFGACESKFIEHEPLFIGLLVLTRRGHEYLSFLSLNRNQIRLRWEDFGKGKIEFVTIQLTGLPAGLAGLIPGYESGSESGRHRHEQQASLSFGGPTAGPRVG
jgi:hypothetical protein